jgi:hypothetical protein
MIWMTRFALIRTHHGKDRIPVALYVRNDNQRSRLIKLVATVARWTLTIPSPPSP